jgi:hypothetical protein
VRYFGNLFLLALVVVVIGLVTAGVLIELRSSSPSASSASSAVNPSSERSQ